MLVITIADATLGAVVEGFDLRELDGTTWPAIEAAFHDHAVLVFPAQHLDDAAHLAFSRWFGPLERATAVPRPDQRADFTRLANTDGDGAVVHDPTSRVVQSLVGNQEWHSDSSFKRIAAKASILAAVVVPAEGGETQFADMRAAYDTLDAATKTQIEDLVCEHSLMYSRGSLGMLDYSEEERAMFRPVRQRLVRTHPVSGRKSLYLSSHAGAILGMPMPEARILLRDLNEHATQPKFVYVHQWRVGDLVMWDNRQMMHRVRRYDEGQPRDMRRTTVAGTAATTAQA